MLFRSERSCCSREFFEGVSKSKKNTRDISCQSQAFETINTRHVAGQCPFQSGRARFQWSIIAELEMSHPDKSAQPRILTQHLFKMVRGVLRRAKHTENTTCTDLVLAITLQHNHAGRPIEGGTENIPVYPVTFWLGPMDDCVRPSSWWVRGERASCRVSQSLRLHHPGLASCLVSHYSYSPSSFVLQHPSCDLLKHIVLPSSLERAARALTVAF